MLGFARLIFAMSKDEIATDNHYCDRKTTEQGKINHSGHPSKGLGL
jgi:hypothetical protein